MIATVRVVVADDHAMVRAGLRRLLDDLPEIEVVGVACDGREALEVVAETEPDVVLMDITMPGMSGLAALARITADHPRVRVVMLSMHDNEEYVGQALKCGASGFLLKDSDLAELQLAIRSVVRGGTYLTPSVSRHVVRDYTNRPALGSEPQPRLTPRQTEIVQLIAEGHRNAEIAKMLAMSTKTVETHRTQLMARLDVHDVTGLVRYAIRVGLVAADR